jgi:hypothetical protein
MIGNFLEGLGKITDILEYYSRFLDGGSNPGPPEDETTSVTRLTMTFRQERKL